ncbi:MAG: carbohydrate-binding protein [Bacillota bacterium]|nr:carbohydrate-binding protein [Bacillota bacterium]
MLKKKLITKLMALGLFVTLVGSPLPQFNISSNQSSAVVHATAALPANIKDGTILHAFDWSFNAIKNELPNIANAGFNTIQVSPVQGTKDSSTDPSKCWLLYQPTNQSVGNAQLGSESDFKALCSTAHSYGIKIIVDVVMNHVANNGNPDQWADQVDYKFKNSSLYHNQGQCTNWNGRWNITQQGIGMPDLNTQNSTVQSYARDFLNQLVADGADGFRFDAAKHIETNIGLDANQSWSGSYWTNTLGSLSNRSNLFAYGEVLQDGSVDNISAYESFLNGVTASNFGGAIRSALSSGNLSSIGTTLGGVDLGKAVSFVETHDTYENHDGSYSGWLTDYQRKMGWAMITARAGTVPLFFDRPTATGSIGSEGDALWKDPDVAAVNQFHNAMAGQNEYLRWTNNNSTMLVDRGTIGTTIINYGSSTYISSPTNLANGTYTNHGSASCTLTVSNGTISGNIPANSIIVLYDDYPILLGTMPPTSIPSSVVTSNPSPAVVGQSVTITYNAAGRVLQNSSTVKLHWGYDDWVTPTDTVMTSAGDGTWTATITVPSDATSALNVCFTDGSNWDNNSAANWSIPVTTTTPTPTPTPTPSAVVTSNPTTAVAGQSITITYSAAGRVLQNSSDVKMHWGYDDWTNVTDTAMTSAGNGLWTATITIPSDAASALNVCFTDGSNWDNNDSANWTISVTQSTTPTPVPTQNPTSYGVVSTIPMTVESGMTTTIFYKPSGRVLQNSSTIKAHWGYDGWKSTTDTVMTETYAGSGLWAAVVNVPTTVASCLNVCFTDGVNWDNNNSANWTISVAHVTPVPTLAPNTVVSSDPASARTESYITVTYDAAGRVLQNSSTVILHWGYDGFTAATDTVMKSSGNGDSKWTATIYVPAAAKNYLNLCFTDGVNLDDNSSANWNIPVYKYITPSPEPLITPTPVY